jgi:hypothetical protein
MKELQQRFVCITVFEKDYFTSGNLIKWNPASSHRRPGCLLKALEEDTLMVATIMPATLTEKQNTYFECPSGRHMVQHSSRSCRFISKAALLRNIVDKMSMPLSCSDHNEVYPGRIFCRPGFGGHGKQVDRFPGQYII